MHEECPDIRKVVKECAWLRGVSGLEHRTIHELGVFLEEMEAFLVYGRWSRFGDIRGFQEWLSSQTNIKDIDADDICSYIKLFYMFCKWRYGGEEGGRVL